MCVVGGREEECVCVWGGGDIHAGGPGVSQRGQRSEVRSLEKFDS